MANIVPETAEFNLVNCDRAPKLILPYGTLRTGERLFTLSLTIVTTAPDFKQ